LTKKCANGERAGCANSPSVLAKRLIEQIILFLIETNNILKIKEMFLNEVEAGQYGSGGSKKITFFLN